jgi:hypothetical protein
MALAGGRPSMVYLNAGAVAVVVAPLALDKGVSTLPCVQYSRCMRACANGRCALQHCCR